MEKREHIIWKLQGICPFLFSLLPFSKHTLFSTVFLLSYALFCSSEETPVNLVGSELSLSRKLPLHIPRASSNTQTALPFSLTFFSRTLQITHFYSLASLQALVPHPLLSHLIAPNLPYPICSSSTQTSFLITRANNLVFCWLCKDNVTDKNK